MDNEPAYLHILDNVFYSIDGAWNAFKLRTALRVYIMLLHGMLIVLDDRRFFIGYVLFVCPFCMIIWKAVTLSGIGPFSEEYVNDYLRRNLRNP
jgi:diacylglycerol kinase